MKKDILKIAGVKSEKEFYKKYPTEAAFMKAHGKEFKKAAMGASMVNKQLTQLTDFSNPPQAEVGAFIGGEQAPAFKAANYTDLYDQADYAATGSNRKMRMEDEALAAQKETAANSKKKGIFDILGEIAPQLDSLSSDISTPGAAQTAAADTDMGANFAAEFGKNGKRIPRAQGGFMQGLTNFSKKATDFSNKTGKSIGQGYDKLDKGLGKIGGVQGGIGVGKDLMEGFQQLKQEKQQQRQAHQSFELSGLTKQVAGLTPDIQKRKYVRPEDEAFQTPQMGQATGSAPNNPFLQMQYGGAVGGNPTEIQNMYNPGDIYSDMGYEPLSDSEIVKQYRRGGLVPKAQFGDAGNALGSWIGGGKGRPTAGGKIGGTIGSTVGKFIPVPGASQALEFVGSTVGSIFGGKSAAKTEKWQTGSEQNIKDAAFTSGAKNLQAQNASFMEDGGWVSHDWQPQVITQFGGYDMKDLLKDDETMNTLRAGGHLKSYTAPSARAMQTYAMGGQLKTTWGGDAETISQNPYLPGTGETVMFKGQSHDEADGNGNTGIGVKYGQGAQDSYTDYAEYGTEQADADVEVERGEPATELPDAETGDMSMVVYGNMQIPSYGASELGDPKIKGKKFKSYANDLSKMEAKQNKTVEKGLKLIDSVDSDNPFDQLKLQSGQAMVEGANMKLKGLAIQKQRLAGIQNAILDTAKERGLESDALAKGKIKQDKNSDMAKFGAKLETAQFGLGLFANDQFNQQLPLQPQQAPPPPKKTSGKNTSSKSKVTSSKAEPKISFKSYKPTLAELAAEEAQFRKDNPEPVSTLTQAKQDSLNWQKRLAGVGPKVDPMDSQKLTGIPTADELAAMDAKRKDKFGLDDALRQLQPYLIPSNQEPIDPNQFTPEMYALSQNQIEPVQAQTFEPLLEQPYSISLQDQLNANQADFNALQRQVGYNPAALSQLAAQKYAANSAILGQQARLNQENIMGAINRNRGVLNDAALKNLAAFDQQYVRQSQAKSNTKAQAQAALSSIADKIAKHKLENKTLGVYENMYNYRFGPKGRAVNVNAPVDWNMSGNPFAKTSGGKGQLAPGTEFTYDATGNIVGTRKIPKGDTESDRNGGIVKAIKNL